MKNFLAISSIFLCVLTIKAQDVFVTRTAKISFFSSTPLEDIDAYSPKASSVFNIKTNQIYFNVVNTSFIFKAKLMEEHFNENYMESEKYPIAEFRGKVLDNQNLSQPGTYKGMVEGELNMHGVTKNYKVPVVIVNQNGKITASANFKVKLADHDIKVPSIVFDKIAEEIDIKINCEYLPVKKS